MRRVRRIASPSHNPSRARRDWKRRSPPTRRNADVSPVRRSAELSSSIISRRSPCRLRRRSLYRILYPDFPHGRGTVPRPRLYVLKRLPAGTTGTVHQHGPQTAPHKVLISMKNILLITAAVSLAVLQAVQDARPQKKRRPLHSTQRKRDTYNDHPEGTPCPSDTTHVRTNPTASKATRTARPTPEPKIRTKSSFLPNRPPAPTSKCRR